MLDFKSAIIIGLIVCGIGIFLGLIFRLLKEGASLPDLPRLFALSINYLIIYPLFFPLKVMRDKETFAQIIAQNIYDKRRSSGKKTKGVNHLKNDLLLQLSTHKIIKVWFKLLITITGNSDSYIDDVLNIILTTKKKKVIKHDKNKPFFNSIFGFIQNDRVTNIFNPIS